MSWGVGNIVPYLEGLAASAIARPTEAFERAEVLQMSIRRADYTQAEVAKLADTFLPVYLLVHARTHGEVSRVAHLRVRQLGVMLAQAAFGDWQPS